MGYWEEGIVVLEMGPGVSHAAQSPSFSGTNRAHWSAIYRSASPEGTVDKDPTPRRHGEKSDPKDADIDSNNAPY